MSQQSFHQQTATGADINFTISTFSSDEIQVYVDGILKSAGSHYNINPYNSNGQSTVDWIGTAPSSPSIVRVVRKTNIMNNGDTAVEGKATFQAGSSVKADDLNNNTKQTLRALQELQDQKIQGYDLEDNSITTVQIANNAITTDNIVNGAIVNADINASADIAVNKLANGTARQLLQTNAGGNGVEFTSNVDVPGTLDVTNAATFDNTVTIGGAVTVNNTTTLDNTTVDGVLDVNGSATIDSITIDDSAISDSVALYLDSPFVFVDGFFRVKPNGNDVRFTVDNTVINTYVNFQPFSTNQYDLGSSTKQFKDLYIDGTGYLDTVSADDITGSAVVTSGTSTSDTKVYSAKRCDELYFNVSTGDTIKDGDTFPDNDTSIATTAAINDRIIDLVDDVGGFVPIANETSFPTANPDVNGGAGTIVSVQTASTALPNGGTATLNGTTLTISNGRANLNPVVITGVTATIPSGFGFLVETTTTLHTYAFHRLVPKATEVTTVAGSIGNVNTVAGSIANVNSVGGNIANVNSVAGNATNINSAVSNATNINSAVSNASNINTVAGISSNVTTVAGISSDVTTVANDGTDIGTVSTNIANVNTVAGISSNVTTVANNNSNVTAVAGNATNINAAVSNASNINSAVSNASNINTVAGNNTNINTVAGISGNVTTVAGNNSNVTTVAGSIANVNTTAGSIANVNTTANSIANVNTTAGSIANVNTTAGSITNVNTVATNITAVTNASTYLNNFLSLYLGTAASDPSVDSLGNPVTEGDLYFNTGTKQLNIFNGSVFTNIVDAAIDFAKSATAAFNVLYTASAGSNSIDLGGLAVTGAVFGNEEIATNRVSLAKGSGTFNLGGI